MCAYVYRTCAFVMLLFLWLWIFFPRIAFICITITFRKLKFLFAVFYCMQCTLTAYWKYFNNINVRVYLFKCCVLLNRCFTIRFNSKFLFRVMHRYNCNYGCENKERVREENIAINTCCWCTQWIEPENKKNN